MELLVAFVIGIVLSCMPAGLLRAMVVKMEVMMEMMPMRSILTVWCLDHQGPKYKSIELISSPSANSVVKF
jgi:hypothetical protein